MRFVPAIERALREQAMRRERAAVERELRLSEERYRSVFETAPEALLALTTTADLKDSVVFICKHLPRTIDRSTLGHPGKFSYCLAEDEENTSWEPLSIVRGMPMGSSAVTVFAAMGPRQIMNEWTTDPKEILETFAAEMRANQLNYSIYGGNYVMVIPPQLREHIEGAGWTKRDVAEFVSSAGHKGRQ